MMAVIRLVYDDVNHHEAPRIVFQWKVSDSVQYENYIYETGILCVAVIMNKGLLYINIVYIY